LQEGNETFRLILSGLTNSTLAFGTNVATITDDDGSSVSFWTNAITVFENTNIITLYALRSGATNTAVSVNFTNLNTGSPAATSGSDFTATNGILTFAPGVTTNTYTLTIIDDGVAENSEQVVCRLTSATNTSLGTSNLVVTITTNDSAIISIATATTSFTETNDTNATITLTVNRTGTTFNQCTVNFATTNVSATAGSDYLATNGTLTFAAGVSTTQIVVAMLYDDLQETNEIFRVVLSGPVDATIGTGTNVVTIVDDDVSSLAITTNAVAVAEAGTNVTFTIIRTGATNTAVAADFTTTNVTASAGSDYIATNNTLYFAPGVTTNTVTVSISDDLLYEGNETFRLLLTVVTNSSSGIATNTATITDDDLSTLTFEVDSDSVSELDGTIDVLVTRTGVTNTTISAAYLTVNGSATAGSDFIATNGVLSFAAGETQKTITVEIIFDGPVESPETFNVRLQNFTNTAAGAETNITVTINDAFGDGGAFSAAAVVPVAISAIKALGNDLRLHITGPAGTPFVIETTTDFRTWTPVSTNVVRSGGTDWLTPIDREVPARYFRVVRPQ
jgi:Calx-beta domain